MSRTETLGTFKITYRGCGHSYLATLDEIHGSSVAQCEQCVTEAIRAKTTPPEDRVRDEWKQLACKFVGMFWPEQYLLLVERGRERSRTVGASDHKLPGVADACEAVGIAIHGALREFSSPRV